MSPSTRNGAGARSRLASRTRTRGFLHEPLASFSATLFGRARSSRSTNRATIENLVYFFVYIQDPTPEIVLWRLFACTALHVVCASLSGFGLARAWRRAAAARGAAEPSLATPWIVAAMAVHGAYNALATAWELLAPGA